MGPWGPGWDHGDPKAKCPHHCDAVTWVWDGTEGPGWGWDGTMGTRMDRDPKAKCPHHCNGVTWGWDGTWDQDGGWDGKMAPKGLGWDQDPRPSVPHHCNGVTWGWDGTWDQDGAGMGTRMGPGWDRDHKAQCPHHCDGVTWGWEGTWDGTMGTRVGPGPRGPAPHGSRGAAGGQTLLTRAQSGTAGSSPAWRFASSTMAWILSTHTSVPTSWGGGGRH